MSPDPKLLGLKPLNLQKLILNQVLEMLDMLPFMMNLLFMTIIRKSVVTNCTCSLESVLV